jgi:hypothetical protein
MKKVTLIFCLLCYLTAANAQTSSKTLVKTLDITGVETLFVDLDGEIITENWDRDNFARIQIAITYENASVNIMTFLISKGRYNLELSPKIENSFAIYQPNYKDNIQINKDGSLLIEKISYTFYVPENVKIINNQELISKSIVGNHKNK